MAAYTVEVPQIEVEAVPISGLLCRPIGLGPHPAVVIIGPVAAIKEQSPIQYATRLAQAGLAALVFDPRCFGASGGVPRQFESGAAKVVDLRALIAYLAAHPAVDAERIYGLGLCQGVNWMIAAATQAPQLTRLALVAGHYLLPATAATYLGGEEAVQNRIARARTARSRFEQTGEVSYIPIVSSTDPSALLLATPIYEWYVRWADRGPAWAFHGAWENRVTAMSEAEIWDYRVDHTVQSLRTPTLMVHADRAASGPDIPRRLFATIPAPEKRLIWLEDQVQMQFYEDPLTIDRVVAHLADWYSAGAAEQEQQ